MVPFFQPVAKAYIVYDEPGMISHAPHAKGARSAASRMSEKQNSSLETHVNVGYYLNFWL